MLGVFGVFFVKAVHICGQRDDVVALRCTGPLCKQTSRLRLQSLPDNTEAANLLRRRNPNPGSHSPPALNQQLLFQSL